MPVEYAHALHRSVSKLSTKKQVEACFDAFLEQLKKEGKSKALSSILREYIRICARESAQEPTLMVARKDDVQTAKEEVSERLGKKFDSLHTVTDANLIGGWRYVDNDTLIDTSYKAALLALYRRITSM